MGADTIVRNAVQADAPEIARLAGQLGYATSTERLSARLAELLALPGQALKVADGEGGRLAGWIHVGAVAWIQSGPYAEIGGLVVDEALRGRGIGERLVAEAAAWATQAGFEEMRVRSNVVRTEAHRFYERLGFAAVKAQQVFHRPLRGTGAG